ncbi:hypothetical protein [Edaphobacter sp. 12200R-103]|uniref:hypothetical protein n=1 Tax=Edaphobacter sp. 12200R-103 TaxID=2703788 RepID=UPI00138CA525|nr:hypothetical protein [Edaphobacter sp. 12200R-103]QHS51792.1 hypothetical protein GWR55_08600 [Edaphobacter sp. 12200R-103]
MKMLLSALLLLILHSASAQSLVQTQASLAEESSHASLPDIGSLMREVEEHQKASERIQKDYLYREVIRQQRSNGRKGETREYDVFWLRGVQVHKLVRKDGKDLTAEEQRKESERIDKDVAKALERKRKADTKGKKTDSEGREEVTVSRFLELGAFSNPRRELLNGRSTIVVDYAGNPNAKTRNRLESVIRDLAGTIWIDERDLAVVRLEGRFADSFKIGAGLVMSIRKGTAFSVQQIKVNNEVWLPSRIEANGAARVLLLFHFDGSILITDSDYRKFKATSTILPGDAAVQRPQ